MAVVVGQHLDLDVAAALDVLLDQQGVVAEGRLRLAPGGGHGVGVLPDGADHAHPLAAAAGRGLDEHGEGEGRGVVGHGVRRDDRYAGGHRDLAGVVLATHLLHHRGGGADQGDAGVLEGLREGAALGEEAVAGVHGLRAGGPGGGDHLVDVEVGADPHGLRGGADVRRGGVEVGVDRDRADAQPVAGADDAQRDLAAVGDQDGLEQAGHRGHIRKMP